MQGLFAREAFRKKAMLVSEQILNRYQEMCSWFQSMGENGFISSLYIEFRDWKSVL